MELDADDPNTSMGSNYKTLSDAHNRSIHEIFFLCASFDLPQLPRLGPSSQEGRCP
jgi:hypothetical protein